MKKLFLMAAIAVSSLVFGQGLKFGPKIGVNLANLSGNTASTALIGGYVGGYANIGITEKFSIQPELLYSMQGAETGAGFWGTFSTGKTKLNYLNIPVMFRYNIIAGLNVELGPQIGILLSAKNDIGVSSTFGGLDYYYDDYYYDDYYYDDYYYDEDYYNSDAKDDFKSVDIGVNIGVNYELNNGLNFSARYGRGLVNISEIAGVEQKNSVVSFGVGYSFGKK